MYKKGKKIVASILVFMLMMTNVSMLGEAFASNLENQTLQPTNNKNVEFDAYFMDSNKKGYTSTKTIGKENYLYSAIKVKEAGYLKNAVITLENANFIVKATENNAQIEKIEENKIFFRQIKHGNIMEVALPIEIVPNESISVEQWNKENKVKFTATYVDGKGKEKQIEKEISLELEWATEKEAQFNMKVAKFIPYNINDNKGLLLQTIVQSSLKDNILPVKENSIEIEIPSINNYKPEQVKVVAKNTNATDGDESGIHFTQDNYTYDLEANKLVITTKNEPNAKNEISWKKQAQDEFVITYLYPEEALDNLPEEGSKVSINAVNTLTIYNEGEEKITKTFEGEITLKDQIGSLIDFQMTNTSELSKGQIYANYQASNKVETEYEETISANIGLAQLTDKIILEQSIDNFIENTNKKAEATKTYYKTISIEKENFEKILGQEGSIAFFANGKKIAQIDAQTEEQQGKLSVDLTEYNVNTLKIETSKPQVEGTINFTITKAMKAETQYSQTQMQSMNKLELNIVGTAVNEETNFAQQTINKEITLIEPTLQAELTIDNNNLSTVVTNQNVKITAILKTDTLDCMLYQNPTLRITLPNYVEEIKIKDIEVLFTGENSKLTVKSYEVVQNANGTKTILVELEGVQSEYTLAAVSKGVNVVITTDITVKRLTPNKQAQVIMQYANSAVTRSIAKTNEVSAPINFVAPTGVVTVTTISDYAEGAEALTSISGEEKTATIETIAEARTAKFSMNVINNYKNTIENISILGRVPFKGNKDIDTGADLGSTINMKLTSKIEVSDIEESKVKIYYSTNANATKELGVASNAWVSEPENLEEVKSYLIVIENTTLEESGAINFSYTAEIPANLQHNEAAYETYAVYFKNNLETGAIDDKVIATKTGVATLAGPVLETSISSNVAETIEVPTGKFIKYTVSVKNIGKQVAEDVTATIDLPNCISHIEFAEGEEGIGYYTEDSTQKSLYYELGNIEVGQTKTQSFWVVVNNLTVEDICKNEDHYIEHEGNRYHNSGDYPHTDNDYTTQIGIKVVINAKDLEKQIQTKEVKNTVTKAYFKIEYYTNKEGSSYILKEGETLTFNYNVKLYDYDRTVQNPVITMVIPEGLSYQDAAIRTYILEEDKVIYNRDGIEYNAKTRTLIIHLEKINGDTIEINTTVEQLPQDVYEKQIEASIKIKADDIQEETSNKITMMIGKEKIAISQTSTIANNAKISAGEDYSYKFEVKNTGGNEANSLVFKTKIPEQVQYVQTNVEIGEFTNSYYNITDENEIEVNFNLLKGQTAKITIEVYAKELEEAKTITSEATISSSSIGTLTSNKITHTIEKAVYAQPENPGNPDNPVETTRRIAGQVWKDENNDGVKDIEEETVANVEVLLFNNTTGELVTDAQGNRIKQVTNVDGSYEFSGLKQGNYTVIFLYDIANFSATTYHADGIDETKNSDAIDTEITLDNEKRISAITEQITINDKNIYNIDLGLVENPKFDLKLDKMVSKITVQDSTGTTIYNYEDTKLAKRDLVAKRINETTILVEYKIRVTNQGAISGYVKKIVDYLPSEMKFSSELNKDWYSNENGAIYNSSLANTLINPGESKEVTLLLSKKMTEDNLNIYSNTAEIYEAYNDLGLKDVDSTPGNQTSNEDDISSADVLVSVKTGEAILFIGLSISIITIIGVGAYFIKKKVLR